MPFTFEPLEIPEILHVTPKIFRDERGEFAELVKASDFASHGMPDLFVQVNYSISKKNALRGLHYQKHPKAQGKFVSAVRGEIFDVAVDMRQDSPSYGKWVGRTLTGDLKNMLYIPAGFAHGFCVLSDEAEIVYFCTNEYAPDQERGILWNDPAVGIVWPIQEPLLLERDMKFPTLKEADNNFQYE
jgi:dTDP-4-dehydrorhamnose 3,5-epimerase